MICKALKLNSDKHNPVSISDVDIGNLNDGEALIRMKAAALNHRDQWIREGKYARIEYNTILGSDGCGVVEKVSDYEFSEFKGKEVVINPNIDWGDREAAQGMHYHILGMPSNGTFSEYMILNEDRLHLKPPHLSFEEAAALPLAGLTAYRACFTQGKIKSQENILITGIGGGVAQMALLFSLAKGANVYVSSSKQDKIDEAVAAGAAGGVSYHDADWSKKLRKMTGGFHVIIDGAGGPEWNELLNLVNYGGRIVIYGATAGTPKSLNLHSIFWKQIKVRGSTMGSDRDFESMLDFVSDNKIRPKISSTRPFSEIINAFDEMKAGGQHGKLVITFDG